MHPPQHPKSRLNAPAAPPYIDAMFKPLKGVSDAAAIFEFEAFQSAVAWPEHWAPHRPLGMEIRIK